MKASLGWLTIGVLLAAMYRFLWLPGEAVWGDAPYFDKNSLLELVAEPTVWTNRGVNFGGTNSLLWISPLMWLYGAVYQITDWPNWLLIRIFFYVSALVLAVGGMNRLAKSVGLGEWGQFMAVLSYTINTYILLLIDGGQVGVALAYGGFPLVIWLLRSDFWIGLVGLFVLGVTDIRLAFLALLTTFLWRPRRNLILIGIVWLGLNLYWLVPILKIGPVSPGTQVSNLQLNSLLNSLLLYQPHFPLNQFGKVFSPPAYFVLVLGLVILGVVLRPSRQVWVWLLLWLACGFLTKGETPPLGGIYAWIVHSVPIGFIWRDSSKFFVPLLIFSSLLMGWTIQVLPKKVLKIAMSLLWLVLVWPAWRGLGGVMTTRFLPKWSSQISGRTMWLPYPHPLGVQGEQEQALDASRLLEVRPIAAITAGTDSLNFLNHPEYLDWWRLWGVDQVILAGPTRLRQQSEEDNKSWQMTKNLIAQTPGLIPVGDHVWRLNNSNSRIWGMNKLTIVVGGDQVLRMPLAKNLGMVFVEDGKWDPGQLTVEQLKNSWLWLVDKQPEDLAMSFLQKYFTGPGAFTKSDWVQFTHGDYLNWKYALLQRGITTGEFDYGYGVALSTIAGEKIKTKVSTKQSGKYVLAIRYLGNLKLNFNDQQIDLPVHQKSLRWWVSQPLSLSKILYPEIINNGETSSVNIIGTIPVEEWEKAQNRAIEWMNIMPSPPEKDREDNVWLTSFTKLKPTEYVIKLSGKSGWIVFSDSYHPLWQLEQKQIISHALPIYSHLNIFWMPASNELGRLKFSGQVWFRWGWGGTIIVAVLTLVVWRLRLKRD